MWYRFLKDCGSLSIGKRYQWFSLRNELWSLYIHIHCLMCVCNVLTNYYFVCVCVCNVESGECVILRCYIIMLLQCMCLMCLLSFVVEYLNAVRAKVGEVVSGIIMILCVCVCACICLFVSLFVSLCLCLCFCLCMMSLISMFYFQVCVKCFLIYTVRDSLSHEFVYSLHGNICIKCHNIMFDIMHFKAWAKPMYTHTHTLTGIGYIFHNGTIGWITCFHYFNVYTLICYFNCTFILVPVILQFHSFSLSLSYSKCLNQECSGSKEECTSSLTRSLRKMVSSLNHPEYLCKGITYHIH